MANILVAEMNVYGIDDNIKKFIEELGEYLFIPVEKSNFTDLKGRVVQRTYEAEFRWNIENTLTRPEVLELTEKYNVGVDAQGYEPGMGFYESVAVQFGIILQSQSWAIYAESAYFDPYDKASES